MVEDPAPAWLEGWRTRRDERCLEELVALYRPMVLTLCRRILRDHAEAEDAAQDTFIALSEHAADIATHPGAWLRAVACRQALMRRRALVRARRHLAAEPAEPATAAADPLLALVDECVDQLEDGERELIYRHYVLDETQRELARHHGVSQVAIHKRLERSIERLRLLMRRRGARIAGTAALVALLLGDPAPARAAEAAAAARRGAARWLGAGALAAAAAVAVVALRAGGQPEPDAPAPAGPPGAGGQPEAPAASAQPPPPAAAAAPPAGDRPDLALLRGPRGLADPWAGWLSGLDPDRWRIAVVPLGPLLAGRPGSAAFTHHAAKPHHVAPVSRLAFGRIVRGLALMPEPGRAAMVRWEWPPGTSWRASYAKTHPVSAPGEIEVERVVSWLEPRPDGRLRHYVVSATVYGPDGQVLRRERLRTEDRHAAPWNTIVLATWDIRTEILGLEIEQLTPAQARVQAALMERPAEDPLPAF